MVHLSESTLSALLALRRRHLSTASIDSRALDKVEPSHTSQKQLLKSALIDKSCTRSVFWMRDQDAFNAHENETSGRKNPVTAMHRCSFSAVRGAGVVGSVTTTPCATDLAMAGQVAAFLGHCVAT
jgi:hypothetical protein